MYKSLNTEGIFVKLLIHYAWLSGLGGNGFPWLFQVFPDQIGEISLTFFSQEYELRVAVWFPHNTRISARFLSRIFSLWLMKIWILMIWNCSRMKDFSYFSENNFTMVENFEFWSSEVFPEWRISAIFLRIFSPWLKNILNFDHLKLLQNEEFQLFFWEYFHHSWRKFWIWWSVAPKWRISAFFPRIFSPWLKKILNFDGLKWLQNEGFQLFSREYFHHGLNALTVKLWMLPLLRNKHADEVNFLVQFSA